MRIAAILNILDEEYQISIFSGIKERALEKKIELICIQQEQLNLSENALTMMLPQNKFFNVDGIILVTSVFSEIPDFKNKKSVEKLWGNLPVVSVGKKIPDAPSILIKSKKAMTELTSHLVETHGYTKFLFMSGPADHEDSRERKNTFFKTLHKFMNQNSEITCDIIYGDFTELSATTAISKYIEENFNNPVQVIVCANDNMTIGIHKFIKTQMKNTAWSSCAVTGFDDIPEASQEMPAFTTVRQPLKKMGAKAVDLMIKTIEKKNPPKTSFIEANLILRQSCGCKILNKEKANDLKIKSIQSAYFKAEQNLKRMNHLGQQLNACESLEGLTYVLDTNLSLLDINDFIIIGFPKKIKPNEKIKTEKLHAALLYKKQKSNSEKLRRGKFLDLVNFIPSNKDCSYVVKHLYTANSLNGFIIYDAPDYMHQYICSISINIAQTVLRIYEQEEKKKYSEKLEEEVSKRTKELIESNNQRRIVEEEVLNISELERQRFSLDLHDDICQQLAGIAMLCKSYCESNSEISKPQMEEIRNLVSATLQSTRHYAHNSYPVELETLGLKNAIGNLCNSFSNQTGIKCDYLFSVPGSIIFDKTQSLNIFRIIQEALHNISKHAAATKTEVSVSYKKSIINISIKDNGKGFTCDEKLEQGLGIHSMQYRANQIDASFKICNIKPTGTSIEVQFKPHKK